MASVLTDDADALAAYAADVLSRAYRRDLAITTAESCTGGLLASLLTDVEGVSSCFERGFVVYTDEAKAEMLGVDPIVIARHGAVSREVALAMSNGALGRSHADLSVSITGFAGPAGEDDEEGLVHIIACSSTGQTMHRECHFGACGRDRIRHLAVRASLEMIDGLISGH